MKRSPFYILFAILFVILTSCNSSQQQQSSSPPPGSEAISSSETVSEAPKYAKNPLTGIYDLEIEKEGTRPVAIMIGNSKGAMPQHGIDSADICYETLAEGGITRIMAVFADVDKLPKIGPVRSSREYFIDLSQGHDAIYAHAGWSYSAKDKIEKYKINNINQLNMGYAFYRENNGGRAMEHTCYTDASHLKSGIQKNKYRTKANRSVCSFVFLSVGNEEIPSEMVANSISVTYSNSVVSKFKYNPDTGKYYKEIYGKPHKDAGNNKQVSVDNVFVLFTPITTLQSGLVSVDLSGGEGYYISGGGACRIKWSKGSTLSNPLVVEKSDGGVLNVNPGQSWICIAPTSYKSQFKIE